MKKIILPLIILLGATASSCVTSLQPLATYNTVIADNRLIGTWTSDGQDYMVQRFFESDFYKSYESNMFGKDDFKRDILKDTAKLSEADRKDSILYSKSYMIKYKKNNNEYQLIASLVKLNGQFYMNFTGAEMEGENDDIPVNDRLESYTIAKIRFTNPNTINLDFINADFLYHQVKGGRMKIKHERDDLYDSFLITASTSELQQFLEKYGSDDRFFDKENSVTLIRKS